MRSLTKLKKKKNSGGGDVGKAVQGKKGLESPGLFFSFRKEYPEAFKENNFQRILGGIFLPGARKAAIVVLCFIK